MTPLHINNFVDFLYLPHYCMLIVYSSSLKKIKGNIVSEQPVKQETYICPPKLSSFHFSSFKILICLYSILLKLCPRILGHYPNWRVRGQHSNWTHISTNYSWDKAFVINNTLKYLCVIFSGHSSMDECFPLEVITAKYVLFNLLIKVRITLELSPSYFVEMFVELEWSPRILRVLCDHSKGTTISRKYLWHNA